MKEYEPKVLRKLQLLELEILKDFDLVCQEHGLRYACAYGTAIGAARHEGFIPWDDDIDVIMMREDYECFLEIAKTEFSEKYEIMNAEIDENYPCGFSKWGLKGTRFVGEDVKRLPCDFRIAVDLFPLDAVSDDDTQMRKDCKVAWIWNKLMILRSIPFPVIADRGIRRKAIHFICAIVHIGMRILHISPKWLYAKYKDACLRHQGEPTGRVADMADTVSGIAYSIEDIFPVHYMSFEGTMLPFPNHIEKYLMQRYGDYMQLPPEEERRNHFPAVLDFGDGERYQG